MRAVRTALMLISCYAAAQQVPCELVAQSEWPNCRFTQRSGGYGLSGPVHTALDTSRELAPDPRTRVNSNHSVPKLFIIEPPAWIAFGLSGDVVENAGNIGPDGKPLNVHRETTRIEGSTRIVTGGAQEAANSFRRVEKLDSKGRVVEQRFFQEGKLISITEQIYDEAGNEVEVRRYNAQGDLEFRGVEQYDAHGRLVGVKHIDHGRVINDMRDVYEGSANDARELISRAWYDENGMMVRQIALRDGQVSWWWQRPHCGDPCKNPEGVGFNFAFDYGNNFQLQPDATLLTTVEHHKGRYGNIENDDAELYDQNGNVVEKIAYRYVRDSHGNWVERVASVLDPSSGQMVDVRIDTRQLTYY
jgi:hypothetical protein